MQDLNEGKALMKTNMELQIPFIIINPNLEEINNYYIQVLNNVINTHKDISLWGQRGGAKPHNPGESITVVDPNLNYYKVVSEHKEIVRMYMGLQDCIYFLKPDMQTFLEVIC